MADNVNQLELGTATIMKLNEEKHYRTSFVLRQNQPCRRLISFASQPPHSTYILAAFFSLDDDRKGMKDCNLEK
jgi:hypothetical protein